jgi:hypothetical protein
MPADAPVMRAVWFMPVDRNRQAKKKGVPA